MIIYDCEIINAIPSKKEELIPGIKYCAGWGDHENMGISVIGAYDYLNNRYRVFCQDNIEVFHDMVREPTNHPLVSFNGIGFDNKLLRCNGIDIPDSWCYDLLREIWVAHGLSPVFGGKTHAGFGLDTMVSLQNATEHKIGNGAMAPVLWQQGRIGDVIDYCLQDVRLEKLLMDIVLTGKPIRSPNGSTVLLPNPSSIIELDQAKEKARQDIAIYCHDLSAKLSLEDHFRSCWMLGYESKA